MRYVQSNKTYSQCMFCSTKKGFLRMGKKENDALQCRTLKSKIVALVMCLVLGISGCMFLSACSTDSGSGSDSSSSSDSAAISDSSESTDAAAQDDAQKLSDGNFSVVKKAKAKKDAIGTLYISGTLKNDSDEDKDYLQISFNVLDKDGSVIGTAFDNINHLKAGATWKYKAMCLDADGYKKFEMAEITGW